VKQYPTIDIVLPGYAITTDEGHPAFCGVFLIEGADRDGTRKRILVDLAHVGRRPVLERRLAERGLQPTDIDMVVVTHAHWDHIQNLDLFDHAPLLLHPHERKYAHRPHRHDWATPKWTGAIIEQLQIREVAEGSELIPGVGIIDMIGHSPGSIGVTVETPRGLAVITGDALHYAYVAVSKVNPLVFWDADAARASIERVTRLADVIYPGHDQPFRLTKSGEIEYLEELRLTVMGITGQEPGLRFVQDPGWPAWVMPGIEEQKARLFGPDAR
jgi:glyoxylase-like metal-dependent hydrolase (beta-lactamase superfamily II)